MPTLLDGDTCIDVEVLAEYLMVTTTDVEQNYKVSVGTEYTETPTRTMHKMISENRDVWRGTKTQRPSTLAQVHDNAAISFAALSTDDSRNNTSARSSSWLRHETVLKECRRVTENRKENDRKTRIAGAARTQEQRPTASSSQVQADVLRTRHLDSAAHVNELLLHSKNVPQQHIWKTQSSFFWASYFDTLCTKRLVIK